MKGIKLLWLGVVLLISFIPGLATANDLSKAASVIGKKDLLVRVEMKDANLLIAAPPCTTSFASCFMELCTGIPSTGVVTLTNNSSLTALNIHPLSLSSAFGGYVVVSSNSCSTLAPGSSCQIAMDASATPPLNVYSTTAITIQGDNTQPVTANISVNGVLC